MYKGTPVQALKMKHMAREEMAAFLKEHRANSAMARSLRSDLDYLVKHPKAAAGFIRQAADPVEGLCFARIRLEDSGPGDDEAMRHFLRHLESYRMEILLENKAPSCDALEDFLGVGIMLLENGSLLELNTIAATVISPYDDRGFDLGFKRKVTEGLLLNVST